MTSKPRGPADPQQGRILRVLVLAQVLSGAGLAAGVTVGALLARDMLDATSLAGVPSALVTIGSALAALLVGRLSQRSGRRPGLAAGYGVGAIGSAGVVVAATVDSVPLLFASLFLYGAGTATNLQARYAGADLSPRERRGRAVSTVLVATTLGAVIGPNLVGVMGDVARTWGVPPLAGPFILAAAAYGVAGGVLWVLLRPDPLLLARSRATEALALGSPDQSPDEPADNLAVATAATVMVATQLVMVAIMTMTPIHMTAHGHSLASAGLVISVHVGAMFLPSPVSGWLVDRYGSPRVAGAAAIVLVAAGVTAAVSPTDSVLAISLALGLLGWGWSLGIVSGTAMLSGAIPLDRRAQTQGAVDLLIAVAGAGGGLGSGIVVAASGYATLAFAGAAIAMLTLLVLGLLSRHSRSLSPAAPR